MGGIILRPFILLGQNVQYQRGLNMNDQSINWQKISLCLYDVKSDKKVAHIVQVAQDLVIEIFEPKIADRLKNAINELASDEISFQDSYLEKTKSGDTDYIIGIKVKKGQEDYLIGLYRSIMKTGIMVDKNKFLPRIIDQNGKVVGRFGRKFK